MSTQPAADPANLSRQLDEVVRRDAEFRLKTIHRFRALDQQSRETERRADALSSELGERNRYIHELHLERIEANRQRDLIHEDVAQFAQWLAAAEDERTLLREQVQRMKASWAWRSGAWLRQLQRWFSPSARRNPPAAAPSIEVDRDLVYYLHTSPFRVFQTGSFVLRGWVYGKSPRPITAVRARMGADEFIGRSGLDEPEVIAVHQLAGGPHARPGFEIALTLSPGRHLLVLEAQIEHREWRAFLAAPVWVRP